MFKRLVVSLTPILLAVVAACGSTTVRQDSDLRGTNDLGLVIEREAGSIAIIDSMARRILGRVGGLGDLSHASAVFSRDGRYAYIFGRDGGLSKVDLLRRQLTARVIQSGNAIGGAISQSGRTIAVSNYSPGGVKLFAADSLQLLADLPAGTTEAPSKVVGLVDLPGERFAAVLFDAGDIWLIEATDPQNARVVNLGKAGKNPYDAFITADGRFYLAGLFGEDGVAVVDFWQTPPTVQRILNNYGKGQERLPVYKMPHLEGWAQSQNELFLPAVGRHELLVVERGSWQERARIGIAGQPIFAVSRPDGRQIWVNFALPNNQRVQVVDSVSKKIVRDFEPGRGVLHMEFTARGENVWLSLRDDNLVKVYDSETFAELASLPVLAPSGIFMTWRTARIGL